MKLKDILLDSSIKETIEDIIGYVYHQHSRLEGQIKELETHRDILVRLIEDEVDSLDSAMIVIKNIEKDIHYNYGD